MNNKKERAVVDKSNNYFTQSFLKILNKLYFSIMHVEDLSKLARFKHLGDLYYEFFYFNETLSIPELQQLKNKIKNLEKKFSYEEISIVKGIVRKNMYDELIENKKILMYMNIFGELPELCEKCNRFVENEAYLKHKENCKKDNNALSVIKNEIIESKTIIKDKQFLEDNKETQEEDIITEEHTQDMILDDLRYYSDDNINSTSDIEKNTIIEQDNLFQDKLESTINQKEQPFSKEIKDEKIILTNRERIVNGEEKNQKLKEQIPKHKKETTQYDEELDPDIYTDEEEYKQNYIEKIKEDIKEFDNAKQNEIIKEIIVVRKKSTDKKTKELREGIKNYLMNTYKGYCQICGFSFRKIVDGKNSFEMFNWNDKRIVKQKKSFITNADSLCLCRNCSANIKWGDFDPIFIDKINDIDGFAHKSVDEIKDLICVKLGDEVVDRFKDNYEWEDIYALKITVNSEPKNIYMTNGHLIQFIAYLQLEENNK